MYVCYVCSCIMGIRLLACSRSPITGLSLRDIYYSAENRTRELARQGASVVWEASPIWPHRSCCSCWLPMYRFDTWVLLVAPAMIDRHLDVTRGRFLCTLRAWYGLCLPVFYLSLVSCADVPFGVFGCSPGSFGLFLNRPELSSRRCQFYILSYSLDGGKKWT